MPNVCERIYDLDLERLLDSGIVHSKLASNFNLECIPKTRSKGNFVKQNPTFPDGVSD